MIKVASDFRNAGAHGVFRLKLTKKLRKVEAINVAKVKWLQLLDERVTLFVNFEENCNYCKCFLVVFKSFRTINKFMHNVDFEVFLYTIKSMF